MLGRLLSSPFAEEQRGCSFTKSQLSLDYAHSRDEFFTSVVSVVNPANWLRSSIVPFIRPAKQRRGQAQYPEVCSA